MKNILYLLVGLLVVNLIIPIMRNAIERVYRSQIDSSLVRVIYWIKFIFWRTFQIGLIAFFAFSLLLNKYGLMREGSQEDFAPACDAILDKDFPKKIIANWRKTKSYIIIFAIIVLFSLVFYLFNSLIIKK